MCIFQFCTKWVFRLFLLNVFFFRLQSYDLAKISAWSGIYSWFCMDMNDWPWFFFLVLPIVKRKINFITYLQKKKVVSFRLGTTSFWPTPRLANL